MGGWRGGIAVRFADPDGGRGHRSDVRLSGCGAVSSPQAHVRGSESRIPWAAGRTSDEAWSRRGNRAGRSGEHSPCVRRGTTARHAGARTYRLAGGRSVNLPIAAASVRDHHAGESAGDGSRSDARPCTAAFDGGSRRNLAPGSAFEGGIDFFVRSVRLSLPRGTIGRRRRPKATAGTVSQPIMKRLWPLSSGHYRERRGWLTGTGSLPRWRASP